MRLNIILLILISILSLNSFFQLMDILIWSIIPPVTLNVCGWICSGCRNNCLKILLMDSKLSSKSFSIIRLFSNDI